MKVILYFLLISSISLAIVNCKSYEKNVKKKQVEISKEMISNLKSPPKKNGNGKEVSPIFNKVREIIVEELAYETNEVKPETTFQKDFVSTDCTEFILLIMAIDKEFNIQIPDEDFKKIRTVQDLVNVVDKYSK